MRDLANKALNIAQQLGAGYVDVRVMERTTEGIDVKNGRVEGISSGTSSGFNVRVIIDGAWGFASSANMDNVEAERVARQAIQIARASALVAGKPVILSPFHLTRKCNYCSLPILQCARSMASRLQTVIWNIPVSISYSSVRKAARLSKNFMMWVRVSMQAPLILQVARYRHARIPIRLAGRRVPQAMNLSRR